MFKNKKSIVVLIFALLVSNAISFAQEKSKEIKTINGVKYYMHTVAKGQTLYAITKIYGQDLNDIVIENPDAIDGISQGQILKILVEKKIKGEIVDSSKYVYHKVEKKETFYSISKKYNISIDSLKKINPKLKGSLKEGQLIIIGTDKISDKELLNKKDSSSVNSNSESKYVEKFKDQYNIALFLPFHADQANALNVEQIIKGDQQYAPKTRIAIQFYQGAMMAIDSLTKQNLNAKFFVYDVDEKDSAQLQKNLAKQEFATMDLIIGPLYGSGFIPVSAFAKQHNIPIISPFTQANKILYNNKYVCKVAPSVALQMEQVAYYAIDSFANDNIILVNNVGPKEVVFFNAFKDAANKRLQDKEKTKNDTVKIVKSLSGLFSQLSKNKINVVVLPTNAQSYVTDFISKLYNEREKYKIVLFGMQNWTNFDNLDFEYLNGLSLHIPDNNFIEYDSVQIKNFIKSYRIINRTEPEMYVFNGFDITYYFISALQKYGVNFLDKIVEIKHQGISTNFEFYKYPTESGYENKQIFILKYKDYKLVNAQ